MSSTPALWYLTRGSGIVTLVLLTATVILGITTSTRWATPRWPRFVTLGLHRNLSLLVLVFLALHVATMVVDGYVPIRWLDAVVPFGSAYRPFWVGLGAIALDLLVAVAVTSLLRARLGHRAWRTVHWLAYACWPVALLHGLGAGSDSGQAWMPAIDAIAVGSVMVAVWWRLGTLDPPAGKPSPPKAVRQYERRG
jgi:DMSO/TMAO reductase YedYZ heme-binding membrane subunit